MTGTAMDFCYEAVTQIYFIALEAVTAYCLYYLIKEFMKERKHAGLAGLAYFVVMRLMYRIPYEISNLAVYGLAVFAAFAVMWLSERERWVQKLFLALTFFSLRWMSLAMRNCISPAIDWGLGQFPELYTDAWRIFWLYVGETFFGLLLNFFCLFMAAWIVRKFYVYKYAEMTKKELLMLSAPSLSGMAGYHMLKLYQIIYTKDTGKSLYQIYGVYHWWSFLYYAVSFASVLVMIVLFQNIRKGQEEEHQRKILAGEMENMKRYISETERRYHDIRSMKHDMGNHVMTLENLYARQEYREAKEYTKQLMEELHGTEAEIKSGNPVTDVILMEKREEAEKQGIDFDCSFRYPEAADINVFDISVILNNAVTNALEHAGGCKNPYIRISSYRRGNICMMEFENSFSGKLVWDKGSGLPRTTKSDRQGHGFGLANIRRVAQKYRGEIEIETNGECLKLSVMLLGAGDGAQF